MSNPPLILHVAINKPVRHCFDYLLPLGDLGTNIKPGIRIEVPFGQKQTIGVLLKADHHSGFPLEKLKSATRILDAEPLLPQTLLTLCTWAARYYHHPIGEVLLGTLPAHLRKEQGQNRKPHLSYSASIHGKALDL